MDPIERCPICGQDDIFFSGGLDPNHYHCECCESDFVILILHNGN